MTTKIFKAKVNLKDQLEKTVQNAVQATCHRLLGKLQQFIDEDYYDVFEPDYYQRTYKFGESAMTKMLNQTCGKVFMDSSSMDYGAYWDGQTQLYMAEAGYHGSTDIYVNKHFWTDFIQYCEENAKSILQEELIKQGLRIK